MKLLSTSRPKDKPLMQFEDVFSISQKITMYGRVESGVIKVGEKLK